MCTSITPCGVSEPPLEVEGEPEREVGVSQVVQQFAHPLDGFGTAQQRPRRIKALNHCLVSSKDHHPSLQCMLTIKFIDSVNKIK